MHLLDLKKIIKIMHLLKDLRMSLLNLSFIIIYKIHKLPELS